MLESGVYTGQTQYNRSGHWAIISVGRNVTIGCLDGSDSAEWVRTLCYSLYVRYISLCVTLTVTLFITQVSHPKSLASYFGLKVFSTLSCTL